MTNTALEATASSSSIYYTFSIEYGLGCILHSNFAGDKLNMKLKKASLLSTPFVTGEDACDTALDLMETLNFTRTSLPI